MEVKQHTVKTNWLKKALGNLENILRQMKMKMAYHNLWDAGKAVPGRKLIAINAYVKNKEKDFII